MNDVKKLKFLVAHYAGVNGVEIVENGLGGLFTISLENSYYESYEFIEKIEKDMEKYSFKKSFWFEPYSSSEIVVGLD